MLQNAWAQYLLTCKYIIYPYIVLYNLQCKFICKSELAF